MVKQCEANSSATVSVAINERDVLKLVLEFLESRRFHIAQVFNSKINMINIYI